MSQDNVLKKEFSKKDVQRVRNLVQGKHGDKVTEGVGYSKKEEIRKEGDIWEADGRKWTIKDGIQQKITTTSIKCVLIVLLTLNMTSNNQVYLKNMRKTLKIQK